MATADDRARAHEYDETGREIAPPTPGEGRTPNIREALRLEMIAAGVPGSRVDGLLDMAEQLGRAAREAQEGRTPREWAVEGRAIDGPSFEATGGEAEGGREALVDQAYRVFCAEYQRMSESWHDEVDHEQTQRDAMEAVVALLAPPAPEAREGDGDARTDHG
jgi:hypothetical protein